MVDAMKIIRPSLHMNSSEGMTRLFRDVVGIRFSSKWETPVRLKYEVIKRYAVVPSAPPSRTFATSIHVS